MVELKNILAWNNRYNEVLTCDGVITQSRTEYKMSLRNVAAWVRLAKLQNGKLEQKLLNQDVEITHKNLLELAEKHENFLEYVKDVTEKTKADKGAKILKPRIEGEFARGYTLFITSLEYPVEYDLQQIYFESLK